VTDAQAASVAQALDQQLRGDVAPDWGLAAPAVYFWPRGRGVPEGVAPLVLLDDPSEPSALLGQHEAGAGGPVGRVFARPVLAAGGGVLDGGRAGDSVSAIASHEAVEMFLNPYLNIWVDGPLVTGGRSWAQVAREACDPVQADAYAAPNGALVSSYVTPAWFAAGARGRRDRLGRLSSAFQIGNGGYALVRDAPGAAAQAFGALGNARPWRAATRRATIGLGLAPARDVLNRRVSARRPAGLD
jgi:hypothetical protein